MPRHWHRTFGANIIDRVAVFASKCVYIHISTHRQTRAYRARETISSSLSVARYNCLFYIIYRAASAGFLCGTAELARGFAIARCGEIIRIYIYVYGKYKSIYTIIQTCLIKIDRKSINALSVCVIDRNVTHIYIYIRVREPLREWFMASESAIGHISLLIMRRLGDLSDFDNRPRILDTRARKFFRSRAHIYEKPRRAFGWILMPEYN